MRNRILLHKSFFMNPKKVLLLSATNSNTLIKAGLAAGMRCKQRPARGTIPPRQITQQPRVQGTKLKLNNMQKNFTPKWLRASLVAVAALVSASASAVIPYDFTADGIFYRVTSDSTVAVSYGDKAKASYTAATVVIPASVANDGKTYSVTEIADSAFWGSTAVTSITIPRTIKKMDYRAFWSAANIKEVNIEDINAWLDIDFDTRTAFSSPTYYSKSLTLNGVILKEITFPEGTTEVKPYALNTMTGITKVTLPSTVKKIGRNAFYACNSLASINLPEGLEEIGASAFKNNYLLSLSSVPSTVKTIGREAFYQNYAMDEFTWPAGAEVIDTTTFWKCTALKSIKIPAGVKKINHQAFAYCSALTKAEIPEGVQWVGFHAYFNCKALQEVNIPASVDSMGNTSFYNTKITKLTIADSKTPLQLTTSKTGTYFAGSTLDTLYIGRDLNSICSTANTVRTAFEGISGVKVLTVGPDVTYITDLYGTLNTKIDSITCLGTVPPKALEFAEDTYKTAKLVVPQGAKAAYQAADVWKNFLNIEEANTTGISSATTTAASSTPAYYTIQGVRVEAPTNGVFIRVQDGKAVKVLF